MKRLVKKFSVDGPTGRIIWSSVDSEPIEDLEWLVEHLIQLGILEADGSQLTVRGHYKSAILQFMDESADFTEEQMERHLKDKRLSGEIAEAFIVQFEIDRLTAAGHRVEAACVKRISKLRGRAGFDINSFDGKSRHMAHDRFIEVKGSGMDTVNFYWSVNEMKIAEELGDRYWIYFVGGVRRKNSTVTREPVMIQNPASKLRKDSRFKMTEWNTLVEANMTGQKLPAPVTVEVGS